IVVPDSLRYTDPFKYKYYIAIKDPLTRQEVRDSLIAAQDTLELYKLDSLYTKDSTEVADAEFLAWYGSLTKKERKKYDAELLLPIRIAEVNAKVAYKDSLKYIRDSIMEATPRILETYAVPDSMQYKRMITWYHDRTFNDIHLQKKDTSYNYYFHDTPPLQRDIAATDLGISGSASQAFNYFRRSTMDDVFFYDAYSDYTYTAENLPMYNTKVPYTELAYWGTLLGKSEKEETNIRVFTTQNIFPSLNITLEYDHFGGKGMLNNESTDNRTFVAAGNYLGKRYLLHAGYIYNRVARNENGGVEDNMWIRDTTVDGKEIPVRLSGASSKIKQNTIFVDQSYRIPFNFIRNIQNGVYKERRADKAMLDSLTSIGDSVGVEALLAKMAENTRMKADTIDRNVTSAFIGHSTEYSVYTRNYSDALSSGGAGSDFYGDRFYINPSSTADSMRVMRFENRVFIRVQPWKEDGILSKLDVGIGDKLLNYYEFDQYNYIRRKNNTTLNSVYLYAGVKGQYKNMFSWDASGDYTFLGRELNDFGVKANIEFNWYPFRRDRKSPLTIQAHFETSLREPDYYQQKLFTNHYRWDNSFGKISTTKISGKLSIPYWKLEAEFDYALLSNNIYYDNAGDIHQNGTAMSVMTASLMKNFKLWWLHFDHKALFQLSSNDEVLPLPMLTLNFRYYLQVDVVKNVMQVQLGADARWFTKFYLQGYNPALGVFYNQNEEKYGNCPFIDVFLNIQWKRTCIFVKGVNIGQGWPKSNVDYFSAHHYIHSQTAIKFGVFWPFYIQPAKNRGLGAKAASGGGADIGNGGGGGGSPKTGSAKGGMKSID
ncbi:MAG: putative porin, partial [Bacteroidales bacterium]|nr:putative porin [Bacteroidales bacterium]